LPEKQGVYPLILTGTYLHKDKFQPECYANWTATPIVASLVIESRSTRITFPDFILANCPFFLARLMVRGKLISTTCPGFTGAAIGSDSNTPPFATLTVLPLKNLFASGSQRLTGQVSSVRPNLRFSITVSNVCVIMSTPFDLIISLILMIFYRHC
jgi:hypothetical protein